MRRLSPDEAALWQRVAGTGRRGPNTHAHHRITRHAELVSASIPTSAPEAQVGKWTLKQVQRDGLGGARSDRQTTNTLDGSWDKRIAGGRIAPERTIDLHGHNLAGAHARLEQGLSAAVRDGVRVVLLVTGRPARKGASRIDLPLRGIIRESVGDWLATSRSASAIAAVRGAHPRHGGAGALYIVLRRAR